MSAANSPLFFAPDTQGENGLITLQGQEFQHLKKVMRLRPGNAVRVTNGQGGLNYGIIKEMGPKTAWIEVQAAEYVARPRDEIFIAPAWNKALRRGWLLEKASELEAGGVYFWQASRSQGRAPKEPKANWRGQLLAGAKQSANVWLPELKVFPEGLSQLLSSSQGFSNRVFLWEKGQKLADFSGRCRPGKTLAILGPEGGFSLTETAMLQDHGLRPLCLGNRTLRWETAALVCLGLFWSAKDRASGP
jgi:16S rRNA (uracil1498-N3)-methyltransferase